MGVWRWVGLAKKTVEWIRTGTLGKDPEVKVEFVNPGIPSSESH